MSNNYQNYLDAITRHCKTLQRAIRGKSDTQLMLANFDALWDILETVTAHYCPDNCPDSSYCSKFEDSSLKIVETSRGLYYVTPYVFDALTRGGIYELLQRFEDVSSVYNRDVARAMASANFGALVGSWGF